MLQDDEWPGLQHQNAVAAVSIAGKEMLGQDRAKAASTGYDHIKRARIGVKGPVSAAQRFVQSVA